MKQYARNLIRRLAILCIVLACVWFCREAILRSIARSLIVDQQGAGARYVVVLGGDHHFDVAADFYREDPSRRILLIEPYPNRLVQIGILPSFETTCRRELAARQVPSDAVELVSGEARNTWSAARLLQRWMNDHPDASLLALCDRFGSRYQRFVLDAVLRGEAAARVCVRGLPDRRYDETDWWQTRRGAKEFIFGSIALAYVWCQGEPQEDFQQWNPDDYERMLCRTVEDVSS